MNKIQKFMIFIFFLIIGILLILAACLDAFVYPVLPGPGWERYGALRDFIKDIKLYLGIVSIWIGLFCLSFRRKKNKRIKEDRHLEQRGENG